MKKILVIGLISIGLAGCGAGYTAKLASFQTNAAATIGAANTDTGMLAQSLYNNCGAIQAILGAGSVFVSGASAQKAVAQAQAAFANYCAGPVPTDVASAVVATASAYKAAKAVQVQ